MALEHIKTVLSELSATMDSIDGCNVEKLKEMLAEAKSVFCYGAGRSGLNARAFAMRLMHLGLKACLVGDTLVPPIEEGDVLIVVTASGSSPAMIHVASKARSYGAKIAVLTTNPACPVGEFADCIISIKAPTKANEGGQRGSVLPMGTLFEEVCYILLDVVVLEMMEKLNITNSDMVRRHANLE